MIKFGEVIDIEKDSLPRILDESILNKYQSSVLQDGDVIIELRQRGKILCQN